MGGLKKKKCPWSAGG